MKKLFIFTTLLLGLFLVSCTNDSTIQGNNDVDSFLGYAQDFSDKIDELMLATDSFNQLAFNDTVLDTSDNQYDMDDFRYVYENQPGMEVDINRVDFLNDYKEMLDDIIEALEAEEIADLDAYINIDLGLFGVMDISCGIRDDGILVRMDYTYEEQRVFSSIKLGYEGANFFIKNMEYYQVQDGYSYHYEEFTENESYFQLTFGNMYDFTFHYVNEVDLYALLIVKGEGVIEAEVPQSGYNIFWTDVDNDLRYNYSINQDMEVISENIDFYNQYGIVLSYMDYDTSNDELRLMWNLLEATGWDYVIINNIEYEFSADLMKNDVNLIPGETIRAYINSHHCLLSLDKNVSINDLSDEMLLLNEYGLNFSEGRYTVEFINDVRLVATNTAINFEIADGLSIYDENFTDSFLDMIDADLSFVQRD